jgi:hypothetical protein
MRATNHRKSPAARFFLALALVILGIIGLALLPFGYACVGFSGNRIYWWISGLGALLDISVIFAAVRLNKKFLPDSNMR